MPAPERPGGDRGPEGGPGVAGAARAARQCPEALGEEIKALIVATLLLEDVTPDDIDDEAPLFVEGLGLDSIDLLDLAMALEERYGVRASEDAAQNRERYRSVRSLAAFVGAERTR
jgi:acyl carrier protein